jgi:hypothetical protein
MAIIKVLFLLSVAFLFSSIVVFIFRLKKLDIFLRLAASFLLVSIFLVFLFSNIKLTCIELMYVDVVLFVSVAFLFSSIVVFIFRLKKLDIFLRLAASFLLVSIFLYLFLNFENDVKCPVENENCNEDAVSSVDSTENISNYERKRQDSIFIK